KQFHDRYQAVLDYYAQANRGRLSPEIAEQLGLPQRVVDELVTEAVVVQRAQGEGLGVDDEEFNAAVHAMREFQDNGRFSMDRYRRFLQMRGVDAERDLRRYLTMRKVQRMIAGGVRVTDAEVEQAWQLRREQVRAAWALVELGPLVASAAAPDEEIAEYFKAHGEEFKQPERRKVQYVTLVAKDFTPKISDADVEKYYTEHTKEFDTPRQGHASHVLARAGDTGVSEAEDKARDEVRPALQQTKDFMAQARTLGLAPVETSMTKAARPPGMPEGADSLEDAAFALALGGVTTPVKTPAGWVVLKVVDTVPAGVPPL